LFIALWWPGETFIDITPYGFHDQPYILTELNLLPYDHAIARISHLTGALLMTAAVAWGVSYLYRQWPSVRDGGPR
jgi:hypothetical protein